MRPPRRECLTVSTISNPRTYSQTRESWSLFLASESQLKIVFVYISISLLLKARHVFTYLYHILSEVHLPDRNTKRSWFDIFYSVCYGPGIVIIRKSTINIQKCVLDGTRIILSLTQFSPNFSTVNFLITSCHSQKLK